MEIAKDLRIKCLISVFYKAFLGEWMLFYNVVNSFIENLKSCWQLVQ